MKFSRLKQASDYEVRDWLKKELVLSPYQVDKLSSMEIIRWSPFKFYKYPKQNKPSVLWRFTIIFWPIYWVLASLAVLLNWCFTGKIGIGQKFLDNFHYPWARKINI